MPTTPTNMTTPTTTGADPAAERLSWRLVGAVVAGTLLNPLNSFAAATPVPALLAVGAVLGVPNGFNTLGLQAVMYETAPAQQMGTAGGVFQTFRCTGAILSTALIGLVLGPRATSGHLHTLAIVSAVVSALLVVTSILTRRSSGTRIAGDGCTSSRPSSARRVAARTARRRA